VQIIVSYIDLFERDSVFNIYYSQSSCIVNDSSTSHTIWHHCGVCCFSV